MVEKPIRTNLESIGSWGWVAARDGVCQSNLMSGCQQTVCESLQQIATATQHQLYYYKKVINVIVHIYMTKLVLIRAFFLLGALAESV